MNLIYETMKAYGKLTAQALQAQADSMTATELVEKEDFVPLFSKAKDTMNMLERPIGFVVKTAKGNVCKLLQVYDSDIYTAEPEELSAQWGFQWSKEPEFAKPFIALATSPYNVGDCCVGDDMQTYASTIDNNVWEPSGNPQFWEIK